MRSCCDVQHTLGIHSFIINTVRRSKVSGELTKPKVH